jgi:hypothetical protein
MIFQEYIGIDYSGAQTPTSRMNALQVYSATQGQLPERVTTPAAPNGQHWNWRRDEIADWLVEKLKESPPIVVGIDHGFSFPLTYFNRYGLQDWPDFLTDFRQHWPTHRPHVYVEDFRENNPRMGENTEFRLTEKWTSSAKSVFQFDVQGQVAKSTHAGIPWLLYIRQQVGLTTHFWPFDGWHIPEGHSVIAEVYPSIFRKRYDRENRTVDQQDAYAVARWFAEMDNRGFLAGYFQPPLTNNEQQIAQKEGWILGIA